MAITRVPLPSWERTDSPAARLAMSVAELGLPPRTVNCLEAHGVRTVEELLECTREHLLTFRNFGKRTLEDVLEKLERAGFPHRLGGIAKKS